MIMTNKENIESQTKQAWNKNWSNHSVEEVSEMFGYVRAKRLFDNFVSILPKDGKLLEGGCGLGPWLIKLRLSGYDIIGVDYDMNCIEKIKAYDRSIPLYVSDVQRMPFESGCFSAYMSLGVLEHFSKGPAKAIKEASRVLEAGGTFLLTLPYSNILLRFKSPLIKLKKNKIIRKIFRKQKKIFYYEKFFKVEEIKRLLENNGFIVERIFPVDHIFTFVQFSDIFRDRNTYDGENLYAIRCADFFKRFFPWLTAGSLMIVAKNKCSNN